MTSGVSLPVPGRHPVLAGPLGDLVLQPWFDRIAPYWLSRWVFPHQRALAAATVAVGLAIFNNVRALAGNTVVGRALSGGLVRRAG